MDILRPSQQYEQAYLLYESLQQIINAVGTSVNEYSQIETPLEALDGLHDIAVDLTEIDYGRIQETVVPCGESNLLTDVSQKMLEVARIIKSKRGQLDNETTASLTEWAELYDGNERGKEYWCNCLFSKIYGLWSGDSEDEDGTKALRDEGNKRRPFEHDCGRDSGNAKRVAK
jgi:hypothetical protein